MEYFKDRPEDLLVIDFTKGEEWEKLCSFLRKDIPTEDFPHYNSAAETRDTRKQWNMRFKFFRKRVKSAIKIKYIDLMGYW
jgi:hypothetical protein